MFSASSIDQAFASDGERDELRRRFWRRVEEIVAANAGGDLGRVLAQGVMTESEYTRKLSLRGRQRTQRARSIAAQSEGEVDLTTFFTM